MTFDPPFWGVKGRWFSLGRALKSVEHIFERQVGMFGENLI
jgi:hypothetical protein